MCFHSFVIHFLQQFMFIVHSHKCFRLIRCIHDDAFSNVVWLSQIFGVTIMKMLYYNVSN